MNRIVIELNTQSNKLTKESVRKNTQIRELELMPKKYFIISTQVLLERYLNNINSTIDILEKIIKTPNNNFLVDEISKLRHSKEGLLKKHTNRHVFLVEIEKSSTQYYIVLASNLNGFKKGEGTFNSTFAEDILNRANELHFYIQKLLDYIQDIIPKVILYCLAAINERNFYTCTYQSAGSSATESIKNTFIFVS